MGAQRGVATLCILATGMALLPAGVTTAQPSNYPAKAVQLVTGGAPGGTPDLVSRVFAEKLGVLNKGIPFIVQNRPGAGTVIATRLVADAPADGHTILVQTNSLTILSQEHKNLTFDPIKDFVGIGQLVVSPNVFSVHPSVPANTFADFAKIAKAGTPPISYGSNGVGSIYHLLNHMLYADLGAKAKHVQYSTANQRTIDFIAGRINAGIDPVLNVLQSIRAGQLRPLAVTGSSRSRVLPDVPTFVELGMPHFERADYWVGFFARRGTAPEIVSKLNAQLAEVLKDNSVRSKLEGLGVEMSRLSRLEFEAAVRDEASLWIKLHGAAGDAK